MADAEEKPKSESEIIDEWLRDNPNADEEAFGQGVQPPEMPEAQPDPQQGEASPQSMSDWFKPAAPEPESPQKQANPNIEVSEMPGGDTDGMSGKELLQQILAELRDLPDKIARTFGVEGN